MNNCIIYYDNFFFLILFFFFNLDDYLTYNWKILYYFLIIYTHFAIFNSY